MWRGMLVQLEGEDFALGQGDLGRPRQGGDLWTKPWGPGAGCLRKEGCRILRQKHTGLTGGSLYGWKGLSWERIRSQRWQETLARSPYLYSRGCSFYSEWGGKSSEAFEQRRCEFLQEYGLSSFLFFIVPAEKVLYFQAVWQVLRRILGRDFLLPPLSFLSASPCYMSLVRNITFLFCVIVLVY